MVLSFGDSSFINTQEPHGSPFIMFFCHICLDSMINSRKTIIEPFRRLVFCPFFNFQRNAFRINIAGRCTFFFVLGYLNSKERPQQQTKANPNKSFCLPLQISQKSNFQEREHNPNDDFIQRSSQQIKTSIIRAQYSCQQSSSLSGRAIILFYNYIKIVMQEQRKPEEGQMKRNYSKITIKKRMLLVKLVLKNGIPLAEAVEQLGLKMTTARFIINKYKETGTFPRRKLKQKPQLLQKSIVCKQQFKESDEQSLNYQAQVRVRTPREDAQPEEMQNRANEGVQAEELNFIWGYYFWVML